jgi:asparagine synthase (glutamine-hydrolysing)
MSRIAGGPAVSEMLRASGPGEPWTHAKLGWIGAGAPNAHQDGELTVVVDGTVFDPPGPATATVARLYRAHGFAGALTRMNFDAAIALRDGDTLWLARDRFGVRPLYHLPDGSAFASRPRALLALPGVSRAPLRSFVARYAASHYRTFDNDPIASPYEAIEQLPAGHLLKVRDGRATRERWWSLRDTEDLPGTPDELADQYRELLLDAVRVRLATAGRPAFTLSGGMDSSSVVASAVHLTGDRQHAFSSVYAHSEYDESDEISSMLDSAVDEWHRVTIGNQLDVPGIVSEMVEAHDEPVATATWLSHHVLCGTVAEAGFDTLFGGLGGDELNAGEYEYFFFNFADLRAAGREDELRDEVRDWVRHHDHPVFRKSWESMEQALAKTVDLSTPGRILPDRARIERYNAALAPGFFDLRQFDPQMDLVFASYLRNRTYQDLFRETAPCCLRAEDRQTRAAGLRNCDPFFDYRLAEFMFRVPGTLKIQHGVTKQLLRRATEGLLPDKTRMRIKKTGWNAPADNWFSGPGRDMLHDIVASQGFDRGIYNVDEVRRLIDEHDEIVRSGRPQENHMMFLWQLVNLDAWLRWLDTV